MPILAVLAVLVAQAFGTLPIDGIPCQTSEGAVEHIHTMVQLYDRGKRVQVPANIGISQTAGCLYWVHTHTGDGYVHIESPVNKPFTLGEFFDIWGADLSATKADTIAASPGRHLSVWINGKAWSGKDPRTIVLRDMETIVIQNGPPFAKPAPADWSKM